MTRSNASERTSDEVAFARAIGLRIKAARKRAGLSQSELAERLDVDQGMVSEYERGHTEPPLFRLHRLARLLGVTVTSLLEGDYSRPIYHEVGVMLDQLKSTFKEMLTEVYQTSNNMATKDKCYVQCNLMEVLRVMSQSPQKPPDVISLSEGTSSLDGESPLIQASSTQGNLSSASEKIQGNNMTSAIHSEIADSSHNAIQKGLPQSP